MMTAKMFGLALKAEEKMKALSVAMVTSQEPEAVTGAVKEMVDALGKLLAAYSRAPVSVTVRLANEQIQHLSEAEMMEKTHEHDAQT